MCLWETKSVYVDSISTHLRNKMSSFQTYWISSPFAFTITIYYSVGLLYFTIWRCGIIIKKKWAWSVELSVWYLFPFKFSICCALYSLVLLDFKIHLWDTFCFSIWSHKYISQCIFFQCKSVGLCGVFPVDSYNDKWVRSFFCDSGYIICKSAFFIIILLIIFSY